MGIDLNKFKNIKFDRRTKCTVCSEPFDKPLFELPDLPMTEIYVRGKVKKGLGLIDQSFHLCPKCGHRQIPNVLNL